MPVFLSTVVLYSLAVLIIVLLYRNCKKTKDERNIDIVELQTQKDKNSVEIDNDKNR